MYSFSSQFNDPQNIPWLRHPNVQPQPTPAVMSMSIHQILTLIQDDELQNRKFTNAIIVAKVLNSYVKEGKRYVVVTDGSGIITLTVLLGYQKILVQGVGIEKQIGKYMFIALTPKFKREKNEWVYFLDKAREIKDFNQISKHLSDLILGYLERTH